MILYTSWYSRIIRYLYTVGCVICTSVCVYTHTNTPCALFPQNDRVRIRECNIPTGRDTRDCDIQQPGEREPCRPHVDNRRCVACGRNRVSEAARDVLCAAVGTAVDKLHLTGVRDSAQVDYS
jgi:Pyruvate/2-oxoacid:ferredoxin oxidoreductase delta subunit